MLIDVEKSHSLPSASWKPAKAGGVVQSRSEGLGTSCTSESKSESLRSKGRRWCPRSRRRREFTLPLPSCSIKALSGLDDTLP